MLQLYNSYKLKLINNNNLCLLHINNNLWYLCIAVIMNCKYFEGLLYQQFEIHTHAFDVKLLYMTPQFVVQQQKLWMLCNSATTSAKTFSLDMPGS